VRQVAARTLGQLASASAQNGLAASLADEDSAVRQAAALAMQRIGWEPTNDVNGAAYWFSLGDISQCAEIGLPAIPFLLKRLSDRRPLATEVLIAIGQPAVDPLATYLEGADKDFRLAVMQVLEQIGGERAEAAFADYLLRCLQDKRETVRREVVTALRQRGWLPTEATQSLLDELNSEPSLDVKKQVIETLGELGPKELAQPLAAWLEDDELTIRRATAHALQQLGWVPQEDLPQAAYWYHLGELDMCLILGESAMRILRQQLTDRHWQARTAAAQILREQLWLPSLDAAGASYWICSGEIDKCTQLGTDAVRPLFDCLAMTPERSADDDSYPNSFRLAQVLEAVWEDEAFKQTVRSLDEDDFDRIVRVMEPVSRWFGYPNPRHYRRVLLWRRQWRRLARCLMPRFIRRIFDDLVFDRLGCLLVECLLLCLVGGALLWLLYRAFADMPLSKNSIMSRWPVEPWVVLLIGWTLVSVSIVVRVLSASRPKVEDDHGSSARHDNP
jgi:HEAT repeat protein